MAPLALAHETLTRRHQLRGSVLPILTMTYSNTRQHLLTADEQALRLFSTRRELAVLWLDPESPSPMILLHHAIHDVFIVVYDDQPSEHPDACAVQILHASLAPLLRWRPHDGAVSAAVLHAKSGILVTSATCQQLQVLMVPPWRGQHKRRRSGTLALLAPMWSRWATRLGAGWVTMQSARSGSARLRLPAVTFAGAAFLVNGCGAGVLSSTLASSVPRERRWFLRKSHMHPVHGAPQPRDCHAFTRG